MRFRSKITAHAIVLLMARVAHPAAMLVVGLYVAKTIGVEAFGQFTFVLSYCFLFSMIFSLGLGTVVTRSAAQTPVWKGEYFSSASLLGLVSGAVGLGLMLLASGFFQLSQDALRALWVFSPAILPSILIVIWESLLITFAKYLCIMVIQSVQAIANIGLGYYLLRRGHGLSDLMMLFLVTRVVTAAAYYGVLRLSFRPWKATMSMDDLRQLLTLAPTFAALYTCSVLLSKMDLLLLAHWKTLTDVGEYGAAYKLLEVSFLLPTCMITALFPTLARHAQYAPTEFTRVSREALSYSMALCLPVVAGSLLFADEIIATVYSEAFHGSVLPFQILILTLAFYLTDQILAHCLIARDLQRLNLCSLVTATVLNLVLNVLLIPKYSSVGAGVATLLSMAVMLSMHLYFVRKHLFHVDVARAMLFVLVAVVGYGALLGLPFPSRISLYVVTSAIFVALVFWINHRFSLRLRGASAPVRGDRSEEGGPWRGIVAQPVHAQDPERIRAGS